jgi:hypothetical protein
VWGGPAKERHVRVEWLACVVVLSITTGAAYAAGPTQAGGFYDLMAPEIGGGSPTITVFALKP